MVSKSLSDSVVVVSQVASKPAVAVKRLDTAIPPPGHEEGSICGLRVNIESYVDLRSVEKSIFNRRASGSDVRVNWYTHT